MLSTVLPGLLCLVLLSPSDEASAVGAAGAVPDLPVAVSSFGAAELEGSLFVFGGHTGRAHQHSFDNLSQLFLRFDLRSGGSWEALPPGPALQGTALVAHGDRLYRVGGLRALNPRGEDEDLVSVASVQSFDPNARTWAELPALPNGRSSHDVAIAGDWLLVVGGWQMRGREVEPEWRPEVLALDLSNGGSGSEWTQIASLPFPVRAHAAVAREGELWVLGGLDVDGKTSSRVDVLDLETKVWRQAPSLPESGRMKGFGADAIALEKGVVVTQWDGSVSRFEGEAWVSSGRLETPRFFHQLVHAGDSAYAIGGASRTGHLSSVERLPLDSQIDARRWTSFRNGGAGTHPTARPPRRLDASTLAWQIELPGFAHSSPVVADDVVYTTSVTGEQMETFWVSAHDLASGRELWQRSFEASEPMESNKMTARAAPTPAWAGDRLVVMSGTGDLLAVDAEGETLWRRNLAKEYGSFGGNHGVGSSVGVLGDRAFVVLARKTYSYLLAVEVSTGKTLWKADREAGPSWTTPTPSPDGREVVVSSNGWVESFDAATGERLWWLSDVSSNSGPSPVVTDRLVLVAGLEAADNFALPRSGRGDRAKSEASWTAGVASYFGSPVLTGQCAVWVNKAGVVHCLSPDDGSVLWRHRLGEQPFATPLAADGRLYVFGVGGAVAVLRDAQDLELLESFQLDLGAEVHGAIAVGDLLLVRAGAQLVAWGGAGLPR